MDCFPIKKILLSDFLNECDFLKNSEMSQK